MRKLQVNTESTVGTAENFELGTNRESSFWNAPRRYSRERVRTGRAMVVVIDSRHADSLPERLSHIARRRVSDIVVYDRSTSSWWTTPYELNGDESAIKDRILTPRQLRSHGQYSTARIVDGLICDGIRAAGYLSADSSARDLVDLVLSVRADTVIMISPVPARVARHIHRVRLYGASLVQIDQSGTQSVHVPVSTSEDTGVLPQGACQMWLERLTLL